MAFAYDNIPDAVLDSEVVSHLGDYHLTHTKANEYNFVCPFCGDLSRPNKKKAYIYRDKWLFRCYKCGTSEHFMTYLKDTDFAAYSRILLLGRDEDSDRRARNREFEERQRKKKAELPFADDELVSLLDHHPLAEQAVAFCESRKIRKDVYDLWFVCQEGDQFLKRDDFGALVLNEKGKPIGNEFRNRLVIPFYKYGGAWNQFDARALDPKTEPRYRNFEGVKRQAYNIDFLDVNKPFYILEGTIDSTFIRNSIAIGGVSHFDEMIADNPQIAEHKENCTVLWDNDKAGELARIESVKKGYNWFSWRGIKAKDVNAAVLDGEFPVDQDGYVNDQFLADRCSAPGGASILFALSSGDLAEREKRARRENRLQLAEKMAAKKKLEVYF